MIRVEADQQKAIRFQEALLAALLSAETYALPLKEVKNPRVRVHLQWLKDQRKN